MQPIVNSGSAGRPTTAQPLAAFELIRAMDEGFSGVDQFGRQPVIERAPGSAAGTPSTPNLSIPGASTPPRPLDPSVPTSPRRGAAALVPPPSVTEAALTDPGLENPITRDLCAMCNNVDLPSGGTVARFLHHFEGVLAQPADADVYRMAPYAIWRDCDHIMAKIASVQAKQVDYEAFHRTCRAWNCVARALTDHPAWLTAPQRETALRVEEVLVKTRASARVPLPSHVPLVFPQDANMPFSQVRITPPIFMEMGDMPLAVQTFLRALQRGEGKVCRHLLLTGPPGSGKTVIARNMTRLLRGVYFEPGNESRRGTYGKRANGLKKLFEDAHAYALDRNVPVVVFLDDIDTLLPGREYMSSNDRERHTVIAAFIKILNPDAAHFSNLVVIGATNRETHIDEAILGRFGPALGIELPDCHTLQRALGIELRDRGIDASQLRQLAALSVGMSQRAAVLAVRGAAHDANIAELRRRFLTDRAAKPNSAKIVIYDRCSPGFTAHIEMRTFTAAYKDHTAYYIFAASQRTWSLELHGNEAKRVGGVRLVLLDGESIVPEALSFAVTNSDATKVCSNHLKPTGQISPQSWYLPWEPLCNDSETAPGTERFAHFLADDSLRVRLEVSVKKPTVRSAHFSPGNP